MDILDTCKGWNCPLKSKCYRHELYNQGNKEKAYEEPPYEIKNNHIKCPFFWKDTHAPKKQNDKI